MPLGALRVGPAGRWPERFRFSCIGPIRRAARDTFPASGEGGRCTDDSSHKPA